MSPPSISIGRTFSSSRSSTALASTPTAVPLTARAWSSPLRRRPTRNLKFALNGAYTDAKLTEDTDPVVGGLEGDPLPYVPDWSLSLSGDYEWPVMDSATAYVGGTIQHYRRPDRGIRYQNRPERQHS